TRDQPIPRNSPPPAVSSSASVPDCPSPRRTLIRIGMLSRIFVSNFSPPMSSFMWIDPRLPTRREILCSSAFGIGAFALAHLLQRDHLLANPSGKAGENLPLNLKERPPHFAPKARAMISLFMHGGPSHVDLLDPKPELTRQNGKDYSGDITYSFVNRASKK